MNYSKLFNLRPDVDTFLVVSEKNRKYFTNFSSTFGYLVINRKGVVFITDFRYGEMAEILKQDGIEVVTSAGNKLSETLKSTLSRLETKVIGYEDTELTVAEFSRYQTLLSEFSLVSVGKDINTVRVVKSEEEIEYISCAQQITDKAFSHILGYVRAGVSEIDIAVELEHKIRLLGGDGLAFDTIVASGVNSSKPHAHPTKKLVCDGDSVTIDFGARFNGYCSDMTRTFFVGEPSVKMLNIYNTVLNAQQLALSAIKEGAVCNQIDKIARDYIADNGFGDCFNHGLGHSLGIDIHESPSFNQVCEDKLLINTFMTVEPGIYVPNLGGVRIEDLVIVTKDGCKNLTTSSKEIIIL